MLDTYTKSIIGKSKQLLEIDRDCIELLYEAPTPESSNDIKEYLVEMMRQCGNAFVLWNEIRKLLIEVSTVNIHDDSIKELLRKIRNDEQLYSVETYVRIAEDFGKNIEEADAIDVDTFDLVANNPDTLIEFHSKVDYISYFVRSMRIGALIASRSVPEEISSSFSELRDCFAFGFLRASGAICRMMMETAYYHALQRHSDFFRTGDNVVRIDLRTEDRLFQFIKEAHRLGLVGQKVTQKAHDTRRLVNAGVIHTKGLNPSLSESETIQIIHDTMDVIEAVYATR